MANMLTGRRVLVVEDEMLILMVIEDMLSDLGCESITSASTVRQALALVDTQDFDLAVLDVNLNGDRSYPVADALAARGVPFAFSTGYSDHGSRKDYHGRPTLKKPYLTDEFATTIAGLLAR
jgi:CheY-like chemotaxis protein